MKPKPFAIEVPQARIDDLKVRLKHVRWPDEVDAAGWNYGASREFMQALVSYWRDHFDWRAQERALNQFPQFKTRIDGQEIHFLHVPGVGPSPAPLLISHGWPSSIAEFGKIIPLLSDPAEFGGRPEDAFDVIAPSLPGFGFSGRPSAPGMSTAAVTGLWAKLMSEVLGYRTFFAHGGDIGGGITNRLARTYPERVSAIHTMVVPPTATKDDATLSAAEREWLEYGEQWENDEGAYGHQQRTRPQTLSYGLNDSPVGLAAWIVEKWRSWSDCDGNLLASFSLDELLTNISIYWFTETIGSSLRIYYESAHAASAPPAGKITVPARVFLTRERVDRCPPEYAARTFANFSYGLATKGGHFFAAEEPEILAEDLRDFFRQLRSGQRRRA